jgi:hypothetical protein
MFQDQVYQVQEEDLDSLSWVLSTKSEEDLDSFCWWVDNLLSQ